MDKAGGGVGVGKLGRPGERRSASRTGRAAEMRAIEPAQYGHLWLKIRRDKLELFHDKRQKANRESFVFSEEASLLEQACKLLSELE